MRLSLFKQRSCPKQSCWRIGGFTDGGVEVRLDAHWHCFMVEEHFADRHRCVGRRNRRGGLCDAIAVHAQDSNHLIRLIEAKRGSPSHAVPQLQRGADVLDAILGSEQANVVGEIHAPRGVRTTLRANWTVLLRTRRERVRVTLVS